MKKTEWHSEVTVRISNSTTITLSDEFGGYSSFIKDKLSKATDIIKAHKLLIEMLQESLEINRQEMERYGMSETEYTESLRSWARSHSVYVEGEV